MCKTILAALVAVLLAGASRGQEGVSYASESRNYAEDAVTDVAPDFGPSGVQLAAAIQSGAFALFLGAAPGAHAVTIEGPSPDAPGATFVLILSMSAWQDPYAMAAMALHEWAHQELGHDPDDGSTEPTDPDEKSKACQEAEAHCQVLDDFLWYATNGDYTLLKCDLVEKVRNDFLREWEKCTGQFWIGGSDPAFPCTPLAQIPCD